MLEPRTTYMGEQRWHRLSLWWLRLVPSVISSCLAHVLVTISIQVDVDVFEDELCCEVPR